MSETANRLRTACVDRVLQGPGKLPSPARQAAFANAGVASPATALVAKIATTAWKITDEDVAALKAGGLSEDAIFELVVSAALGQSTRQLDAAFAALDAATQETR